jgi:dihydrodipicolinate synthase/N-acetylneuraminate lyase
MAYGLSTRALIADANVDQAAAADLRGSTGRWQTLSEASRLELIEQALRAANDRIDGYPLAL